MEVSVFEEIMKGCGGKVMPEFPEIRDGVKVRSELKTEDLRLIKRAFVVYCESGKASVFEEGRMMLLMKRMLRKVK